MSVDADLIGEKKDQTVREFLSFLVADQDFAVDIMSVREIRMATKATPLPRSPDYVLGVINLRGAVLPIMALAQRLEMKDSFLNDRNVIIVVAVDDQTMGLRVDAVSDILSVADSDLQTPPDLHTDSEENFVSALTIHDGRMIRILDLQAVIPKNESEAA